jgi:hypothetical protein
MSLPLFARPAQRFEKRDLYLPNSIPPAVKKGGIMGIDRAPELSGTLKKLRF